jgi:nucleoside-diphosphate-sugar epimerase
VRYLVTGATGLVGSHLVDALLERGETVRALVFEPEAVEALRRRGVDVRPGDLTASTDLAGAVDAVDAVVHCAGVVHLAAQRDELWAVNVEGTERLLAAAAGARSPRFVYISSVGVYGHASPPVAEDAPKQPVGAYAESKWAAEQAVWRWHAEHGLPAVALRPCPIYGPRDRRITQGLARLGRMRVLPLPGGGRRLADLVYVSDVVDAAVAAATAPAAVGHAYNVTDGEAHSYRDFLLAHEEVTGRRPVIVPVPGRLVVLAVQAGMRLRQARRPAADWAGQLARVRALDLDAHYSIDAARRDLGYRPRVGLREGLRRTFGGTNQR